MENVEGTYLYKSSCDDCGSSDANSHYSDGATHCFSCGTHTFGDKEESSKRVACELRNFEGL